MLCSSLDGRGVWERMDTCICLAESLCCPPETVTTLLIGYIPIQNNKFFKRKKMLSIKKKKERKKEKTRNLSLKAIWEFRFYLGISYLSPVLSAVVKNLPASAGEARDTGSIPGSGRYAGGGHGNPPQYSCLENSIDRGVR